MIHETEMKSAHGMPRPVMPLLSGVTGSVTVLGYIKRYATPAGLLRARGAGFVASFATIIYSSACFNFLTISHECADPQDPAHGTGRSRRYWHGPTMSTQAIDPLGDADSRQPIKDMQSLQSLKNMLKLPAESCIRKARLLCGMRLL